jgi:hypothetical protein
MVNDGYDKIYVKISKNGDSTKYHLYEASNASIILGSGGRGDLRVDMVRVGGSTNGFDGGSASEEHMVDDAYSRYQQTNDASWLLRNGQIIVSFTPMKIGAQGDQGDQGFQGQKGTKGDQGFQGFQGDDGSQGFQGIKGTDGEDGAKGDQGDTGL